MKKSFLGLMVFALAGSASAFAAAPQYVLSYFVNPGGNQTTLTNGVIFPPTTVGVTTTATVVIFNNGDGDRDLSSVSGSGGVFK